MLRLLKCCIMILLLKFYVLLNCRDNSGFMISAGIS